MAKGTALTVRQKEAPVAVQRRKNDRDLRDRLVRVEGSTDEIPRMRDRLHVIGDFMQQLIGQSENADDERKEIRRKVEDLWETSRRTADASERAATTMQNHMSTCERDKKASTERQAEQHEELSSRLRKIEQKVWVAIGGFTVISFLAEILVREIFK